MNKKVIRLTEGDLHRIVKESINSVLNESFKSKILRDLHKQTPSEYRSASHGLNDFNYKTKTDLEADGVASRGLNTGAYLDKITDDMIEAVGTREELSKMGYSVYNFNVYDSSGRKRYVMRIRNGKMVVFKNDPETIEKMKKLSQDAFAKYEKKEKNKYNDGAKKYQWSTFNRGNAFDEWKNTGLKLWDDPEFRSQKGANINPEWRKDSWVKQNMDKALRSYGRKKEQP